MGLVEVREVGGLRMDGWRGWTRPPLTLWSVRNLIDVDDDAVSSSLLVVVI